MNKIQSQVQQIISDKIAPCVLFWVEQDGQLLYQETQGTTMYEDTSSLPIVQDAIFDVASITKIMVATAVLMLIDKGILSLNDTLEKFIPSSTYGQNVTVQHLLTHTSGISVQMSRLAKLESREQMWEAVLRAPLAQAPGVKVVSTNVNTFLLGRIIETVAQEQLDHFLKRELFVPLDMQDTYFNPPETTWGRIPPTEIMDGRGLVRGQVHDESAFALGGIVGHAGLFSTAGDLRKFGDGLRLSQTSILWRKQRDFLLDMRPFLGRKSRQVYARQQVSKQLFGGLAKETLRRRCAIPPA